MKKLLNPSDKILLSLAFLGDVAIEVYARGHGFGWKRSIFEALDIKNSAFRAALSRFLKTGEIEKVIDRKGRPCFRLRAPGAEKIERMFPLFKLNLGQWDGKWRVVIFDIEEKKKVVRNFLRRKLVSLGFGQLQESVYISPLDVLVDLKEFLKNEGIYGQVVVFEAKEVFGQSPKAIAKYVWRLESLDEEYQKLADEAEWIKNRGGTKEEKKKLKEELFQLLLKDPLLPKEFLPDGWMGEKVRKTVLSLA